MQQHGQTVFMVEQLQPSWLATSRERVVYTLDSRLIVGLLYGLIFGAMWWYYLNPIVVGILLLFGFIFGLSVGLLDVFRSVRGGQTGRPKTRTPWQSLKSVCIVGAVLFVALCVGLLTVQMLVLIDSGTSDIKEIRVLQGFTRAVTLLGFVPFVPTFAIIWGVRKSQRTPGCDIQCVETLAWSWRAWKARCAPFLILGLVLGLVIVIVDRQPVTGAIVGMSYGFIPGLLFGTIAGLTTGVEEMKTVPNQGIRLSMRCAIYGGLVVGMTTSPVLGFVAVVIRSYYRTGNASAWHQLGLGLVDGLVLGLAVALIAGTWFGGLNVILHYFLRLQLYMKGRTPLNLVRFLDYAAKDLNFLQKVGGGYIFIHRMLLEHFAAMQTEGKSNPQETPRSSQRHRSRRSHRSDRKKDTFR